MDNKRGNREKLHLYDDYNKTILYNIVKEHDKIYSLLYSPTRIPGNLKEQIIEIDTNKLNWSKDHQIFYYIWGYPGPDLNRYTIETYGKGWAFTREEIFEAWGEE